MLREDKMQNVTNKMAVHKIQKTKITVVGNEKNQLILSVWPRKRQLQVHCKS